VAGPEWTDELGKQESSHGSPGPRGPPEGVLAACQGVVRSGQLLGPRHPPEAPVATDCSVHTPFSVLPALGPLYSAIPTAFGF
jgi:hypothetical protein